MHGWRSARHCSLEESGYAGFFQKIWPAYPRKAIDEHRHLCTPLRQRTEFPSAIDPRAGICRGLFEWQAVVPETSTPSRFACEHRRKASPNSAIPSWRAVSSSARGCY